MWTDTHCHLPTDSAREWLDQARAGRVDRFVTVGTDLESSAAAISLAEQHEGVFATVGVHPHDAVHGCDGLEALLASPVVVAVGECGLDYFYLHSEIADQRTAFEHQIALAKQHHLALVIHTRDAWDDTFAILDEVGTPDRTVFHCFTGGPSEAERCLALGAFISFSGIVTFPKAPEVAAAARMVPLDRIVVETDSPYLSPVPFRGKPNRPQNVAVVGEFLASLLELDAGVFAAQTSINADALFGLNGASQ